VRAVRRSSCIAAETYAEHPARAHDAARVAYAYGLHEIVRLVGRRFIWADMRGLVLVLMSERVVRMRLACAYGFVCTRRRAAGAVFVAVVSGAGRAYCRACSNLSAVRMRLA
jgi:hypothetical protein